MAKWKCLVKMGHLGAGNSRERIIVVKGRDVFQAMKRARFFPGVKSHLKDAVLRIERLRS
ncbi:MAG: hypothetical protein AB1480_09680 [Nitrospirota bacterium]